MKYKLLCCDVDGTLVDGNGLIPEDNKKAIKWLEDQGIIFVICTGRVLEATRIMNEMMQINPYVVSMCGAMVQTPEGKIIRNDYFSSQDVRDILAFGEKYKVPRIIFSYKNGVIQTDCSRNYEYTTYSSLKERARLAGVEATERLEIIEDPDGKLLSAFPEPFGKISLWFNEPEEKDSLEGHLDVFSGYEVTCGVPENLELLPRGVSKWSGIQSIMDYHGIKAEEVICIGDSMNDSDMIIHAGMGVAMDNASDEVKALADYITASNEEAGVARAIEHFFISVG